MNHKDRILVVDYLAKIKGLIKLGFVTGPANNDDKFPVQQMTFKGKAVDVMQLNPYGLYSNVKTDSSLGLMFVSDCAPENRAALCFTPEERPRDLENGEVCLYHPFTNSFIKFRNNGDLEIQSQGGGSGELKIVSQGNVSIDTQGATTVTSAGTVTLDASQVNVTGNLDVAGNTTLTSNVTSNGVNIGSTHTHTGSPTAPDGPVTPTGAPV